MSKQPSSTGPADGDKNQAASRGTIFDQPAPAGAAKKTSELIPLCQYNPKVLYDLLFQATAATLLEIAADRGSAAKIVGTGKGTEVLISLQGSSAASSGN